MAKDEKIFSNSLRMKIRKRIMATLFVASLTFSLPMQGILTSGTVESGQVGSLDGTLFSVNFGSVDFVSDLSSGGLRFNRVGGTGGTQIATEDIVVGVDSELCFNWSVVDNSMYRERSLYQIIGLDTEAVTLHEGLGFGNAGGSVSRALAAGSYQLQVSTAFLDFNVGMYDFTFGDLQIKPLEQEELFTAIQSPGQETRTNEVPDSSLGLLGLGSILGLFGARRRFGLRKS